MESEVRAVMELCKEAEISTKLKGKISKCFNVNAKIHQGSVLSLLLFVFDALSDGLEKPMKEFLYTDNLVVVGDCWKNLKEKYIG